MSIVPFNPLTLFYAPGRMLNYLLKVPKYKNDIRRHLQSGTCHCALISMDSHALQVAPAAKISEREGKKCNFTSLQSVYECVSVCVRVVVDVLIDGHWILAVEERERKKVAFREPLYSCGWSTLTFIETIVTLAVCFPAIFSPFQRQFSYKATLDQQKQTVQTVAGEKKWVKYSSPF